MTFLKRRFLLALPLVLSACESDEDIARKEGLADELIKSSTVSCDLQSEPPQTEHYTARLKSVLMDTMSKTLDFIIENDITVCLDQRLGSQSLGFFDYKADALFYPETKTLTLSDNGDYADFHSDNLLSEFKRQYGDGELASINQLQMGYTYSRSRGKGRKTVHNWEDNAESKGAIENNPYLLTPPLK